MAHGKLPWKIITINCDDHGLLNSEEAPDDCGDKYRGEYIAIVDADGEIVVDDADYYPQPVGLENAKLIVDSVNKRG